MTWICSIWSVFEDDLSLVLSVNACLLKTRKGEVQIIIINVFQIIIIYFCFYIFYLLVVFSTSLNMLTDLFDENPFQIACNKVYYILFNLAEWMKYAK